MKRKEGTKGRNNKEGNKESLNISKEKKETNHQLDPLALYSFI